MRSIILILIAGIVSVIFMMVLLQDLSKQAEIHYKEYRSTPDTTITIKNRISDTLITIKK